MARPVARHPAESPMRAPAIPAFAFHPKGCVVVYEHRPPSIRSDGEIARSFWNVLDAARLEVPEATGYCRRRFATEVNSAPERRTPCDIRHVALLQVPSLRLSMFLRWATSIRQRDAAVSICHTPMGRAERRIRPLGHCTKLLSMQGVPLRTTSPLRALRSVRIEYQSNRVFSVWCSVFGEVNREAAVGFSP